MVDTIQPPPDDSDEMTSSETQTHEDVEPTTAADESSETTETGELATASDDVLAAEEAREEAVDATILEVPDLSNAELVDIEAVDDDDEVESRSEPSPFVGRPHAFMVAEIEAQLGGPLPISWETEVAPLYEQAFADDTTARQ